ncbi:LysR family transcriptional regulator [Bordetella genomosp. 10]|uniref:LysR family transcriptional regulator n=1 Tax=Bordetella genomosp. 10 TaxID=1416804 RepID=A0A261S3M4_9BORD|nr:LysR family transcriptional regulator [Bordetella genomosp. 10]OZI31597.1 LysR family transcriptional regulator [Bordetella genomosp. 10]
MNFKQIETFRAVMLTRSMTLAASQLHTSQPNVTRVISQLEKEVGFALFERVAGRIFPTLEAEALLGEVERAFVGLDSLSESARSIRQSGAGSLRVGAVASIAMSIIPEAMRLFTERYPKVPVVIHTNGSPTVAKWTSMRYCDVGLVSYLSDIPGIETELLRKERGVCVVPAEHRLARKRLIQAGDLAGERFISLPHGSSTRLATDAAFAPDERELTIETPYATTICRMVGLGLGVGIVNPIVSRSMKTPGMKAIPFAPAIEFSSYVLKPVNTPSPRLVRAFLECVEQAWPAA